jgi:hypothetical protein
VDIGGFGCRAEKAETRSLEFISKDMSNNYDSRNTQGLRTIP